MYKFIALRGSDGFFICLVCKSKFHGACCGDFDISSMDVIWAVIEDIGWVCDECRELAMEVRSSQHFGKGHKESNGSGLLELKSHFLILESKLSKFMATVQRAVGVSMTVVDHSTKTGGGAGGTINQTFSEVLLLLLLNAKKLKFKKRNLYTAIAKKEMR